jgi:hypothetical protein
VELPLSLPALLLPAMQPLERSMPAQSLQGLVSPMLLSAHLPPVFLLELEP